MAEFTTMGKIVVIAICVATVVCALALLFEPLDPPEITIENGLLMYYKDKIPSTPAPAVTTPMPVPEPTITATKEEQKTIFAEFLKASPTPTPRPPSVKNLKSSENITGLDDPTHPDSFVLGYGQLKPDQPISYFYYSVNENGLKTFRITPESSATLMKDEDAHPSFKTFLMSVYNGMSCTGAWTSTSDGGCMNMRDPVYELHVPKTTIIKTYVLTPESVMANKEVKP